MPGDPGVGGTPGAPGGKLFLLPITHYLLPITYYPFPITCDNFQPMKNQRRCVACRRLGGKESFWRFVRLYPSHQVQLDHGMGRSAYLCPNPDCLKLAQKKNRLGHSLRASVSEEVYQSLWQRLD